MKTISLLIFTTLGVMIYETHISDATAAVNDRGVLTSQSEPRAAKSILRPRLIRNRIFATRIEQPIADTVTITIAAPETRRPLSRLFGDRSSRRRASVSGMFSLLGNGENPSGLQSNHAGYGARLAANSGDRRCRIAAVARFTVKLCGRKRRSSRRQARTASAPQAGQVEQHGQGGSPGSDSGQVVGIVND